VRKGGARNRDLLGDIVRRHWDTRGVRRQSQGLGRVQGRMAMGEGAPHKRTEGGTGHLRGGGVRRVEN
jgi:hypothetical protein